MSGEQAKEPRRTTATVIIEFDDAGNKTVTCRGPARGDLTPEQIEALFDWAYEKIQRRHQAACLKTVPTSR